MLRTLLRVHGARGAGVGDFADTAAFSELDRLAVVPMLFGLIPNDALTARRDTRIKPFIEAHLHALDVPYDEELVDLLRSVAKQFAKSAEMGRARVRGIAYLRANQRLYARIRQRQAGRCAVCGVLFQGIAEELDHILPRRLVGDPADGSNWQILCSNCNRGKADWVSAIQLPAAFNWLYRRPIGNDVVGLDSRYVVLAQRRQCEDCGRGARQIELRIARRIPSGLPVADHLTVLCVDDVASAPGGEVTIADVASAV